jgi:glycosyltransferase involved in cell wall biosynthesis
VTGFFLPVPAINGGATERSWDGLARIFASSGHTVTFISRSWPGLASDENASGVHLVRLPGFNHTAHLFYNLVLDFLWGLRVMPALPPGDIVICNTISLPVWLRLLKPSAGAVSVMIGRAPKGQVRFYRSVARIYAPSTFVAGQIDQEWASVRTRVIGYPIDWQLHSRSSRQSGIPVTIGYVGRLHPEKGISILVRAACLLARRTGVPEWRLKIAGPSGVGEGGGGEEWLNGLRKQAADSLGTRIEWLPPEFDPARLAQVYGGMDVFCYPSIAESGETFGVSVAEAMASKCAVVVSALACFSDLVRDGDTGLVFDHAAANSDQILADRLELLVARPDMRKDLALRGQQHARRFDYPEVSGRILEDLTLLTGAGAENRR